MDELCETRAEYTEIEYDDLRNPLADLVQNAEDLFVTLVDSGLDEEAKVAATILERARMANAMIAALQSTAGFDMPGQFGVRDAASQLAAEPTSDHWTNLLGEPETLKVVS